MRKFLMIGFYGILSGAVLFGVVFLIKLPDILEQRILRKRQILEQEENRKKKELERRQKELRRKRRIVWEKCQYFFNHLNLSQIKMMRQSGELDFEVATQIFQQLYRRSSRVQEQAVKVISQVIVETNDFDFLWWSMQIEKQQLSNRYVPEIFINIVEKIVEDLWQQHAAGIKTSDVKNNFLFVFHKTKTLRAVNVLIWALNNREFEQRSHKVLVSFLNYHFSSIGDEKIAQTMLDILIQEYLRHSKYRKNIVRAFLELNIGLQKIWAMNNQLSLDSILQICEQLPLDNLVVRQRAIENICKMIVQTKRFDLLWQNTSDDLSNANLTEIILRIHEMVDLEEVFVQNWQNIKRFSVKKALFSVLENTQSLDTINMLITLLEEIALEGKARETLATILNNLRLTNNDLATKIQQRLVVKYQQGNTSLRANIIVIFSRLQSKDNTIMEILEKASDDPNRFIKMLAKKTLSKPLSKKTNVPSKDTNPPIAITNYKAYFLSMVEQQRNKKYVIDKSDLEEVDKYGEIDSIHKIVDILQGSNEKLSFYAAKMLSRLGDTEVIPLLVDTKKQQKSFVILHTLQVLRDICTRKHKDALMYLRNIRDTHRPEFIKLQVAMVIDRIRKRGD